MPRITIKDLAKKLGVSPSTVSRALADHPDISVGMKKKVRKLAEELHYIKNRRASSLRTKTSEIIALIVPDINMFFMPELIYGVNTEAEKYGLSVVILQTNNSLEKERFQLQYCLEMRFKGVLLCLSFETKNLSHIDNIIDNEIPVVQLDKVIRSKTYSAIAIQDYEAGLRSGNYLRDKGHTSVLGLFANPTLSITKQREKGFRKAFTENGIPDSQITTLDIENILELDTILEKELENHKDVTAIFCMSDELLVNSHHLLMKLGYKIPDDISLFAISDGFVPYYLYPNITHLHHSGFEVGVEGVKEINRFFSDEDHKGNEVSINTKLFEMDSVKDLTV